MSRFNTSFLTFTFVARLDGFSQCCFATRANSDPSSATASTTSGAATFGVFALLFFCLFAGGMMVGLGRRSRHCVAFAVELDAPGILGNIFNMLEQHWKASALRHYPIPHALRSSGQNRRPLPVNLQAIHLSWLSPSEQIPLLRPVIDDR